MTLNLQTYKYELPPPRWFNKDTGEYENIKPMYFLDPNNPSLGLVLPSKVVREDDAFRQFMHDKETKRRLRIQREREEAERARLKVLNPPPVVKIPKRKDKTAIDGFDEELAQKSYRERTGKMFSKRGATQFTGPSASKEIEMKKELEERYEALKPFTTGDASIEELPPSVNVDEIINAWKNSPAIRSLSSSSLTKMKVKSTRTEGDRVRALVRNKSGLKRGWTFAAMRGSYRPPNTIQAETKDGWIEGALKEEDASTKRLREWRQEELQSTAWWEKDPSSQWRSRSAVREEHGRLAINPVTGKLEDIAPPKQMKAQLPTKQSSIETGEKRFLGCELMSRRFINGFTSYFCGGYTCSFERKREDYLR